MKRSEMLKIIQRYIGVNFPEYSNEAEMYSDSLLDVIEDEGMLPPAVYSELFGFDPEYKWEEE